MKTKLYIFIPLFFLLLPPMEVGAKELRERAYVQTDKDLYLSGELMWLKMILTDERGNKEYISRVGYVELLDDNSSQVQAKLDIVHGIGTGWIELPATLSTGNYRLVGYTRYMLNEEEEVRFNKLVTIINPFRIDKTIEVSDDPVDVNQRMPVTNTIGVRVNKTPLGRRENGEITLDNLPANIRTLSVSISGNDMLPSIPASHIMGWRNELLVAPVKPIGKEYVPEYEGHIIQGQMIDLQTGAPYNSTGVVGLLAFAGDGIRLFNGQFSNRSDITFYTKRITGRTELATTTLAMTDNLCRIDITSPFANHTDQDLLPVKLYRNWEDKLALRSMGLQVQYAFTADSLNRIESYEPYFRWKPDWVYILDEYTRFTTMEEVVIEFIIGLRFRRLSGKRILSVLTEDKSSFTIGNSLVLLDGIPIKDHEVIFRYDPLLLERVEVYKGRFVFGGQMFDGIASFKTYKRDYPALTLDNTTQFFDYEGTVPERLFYAPDYSNEVNKENRLPDYRHTLLWIPEVETEGQRNVTVPFSTSDIPGEYTIKIEGLTDQGNVIIAEDKLLVQ